MSLCLITPRFYPVIGGNEKYFLEIAKFCSSFIDTKVITSNLISTNKPNLFDRYKTIKKGPALIGNVEVIRANTIKNQILKTTFYMNQYLNKSLEMWYDKKLNPQLYANKRQTKKSLSHIIKKIFINQRIFSNPNFFQIYHILKKIHSIQEIKIIHTAPIYLTANLFAYKFANKHHIPFIIKPIYHINPYQKSIFYPSYQYILEKSDIIIAETITEKIFYENLGLSKEKIIVISPGIDPNTYNEPNVEKFKKKYNIPSDSPLLFSMGRRTFEKGFPQTIISLKYLIKKFRNIRLLLAGYPTKEFKLFYEKIPDKIKNYIIDLGFIDDQTKVDAFASSDIFVLPSLDDAFGLVYLEAWLFRKPVIGALEGNVASLIDDGVNGYLIPSKNVKELSFKLKNLLENPDLRKRFGENGYKKLINNYLMKRFNYEMLNLYRRFI